MLKMLLRTPAVASVNTKGAAQDPDLSLSGRSSQGTRQRMTKAPTCQVKNRLPRTRDPLLAEEPVMSITAWIVPRPLERHMIPVRADTGRRPGWANR
jgi:hypothetical protein